MTLVTLLSFWTVLHARLPACAPYGSYGWKRHKRHSLARKPLALGVTCEDASQEDGYSPKGISQGDDPSTEQVSRERSNTYSGKILRSAAWVSLRSTREAA